MIAAIVNVIAWILLVVCGLILAAVAAERFGLLLLVVFGAGWAFCHLFFKD